MFDSTTADYEAGGGGRCLKRHLFAEIRATLYNYFFVLVKELLKRLLIINYFLQKSRSCHQRYIDYTFRPPVIYSVSSKLWLCLQ